MEVVKFVLVERREFVIVEIGEEYIMELKKKLDGERLVLKEWEEQLYAEEGRRRKKDSEATQREERVGSDGGGSSGGDQGGKGDGRREGARKRGRRKSNEEGSQKAARKVCAKVQEAARPRTEWPGGRRTRATREEGGETETDGRTGFAGEWEGFGSEGARRARSRHRAERRRKRS